MNVSNGTRPAILLGILLGLCLETSHAAGPDLIFQVSEFAGVGRTNEVLASGLPLARDLAAHSTSQLQVTTLNGQPMPARFHVLARWNAGRANTNAALQWVLLEMPVSVPANETRHFRLVVSSSEAAVAPIPTPLRLTEDQGQLTIDTGVARFQLGDNPNALFDEVRLRDGTLVATGTAVSAVANGQSTLHNRARQVKVERVSDLAAVVVVDGLYDLPPVGTGGLASNRRYEFFAGSATVLIRHEVAWEGNLAPMGVLGEEGVPNGIRMTQVRDTLKLHRNGPRQALVWGAIEKTPFAASVAADAEVKLHQTLRDRHTDPQRFHLQLGEVHQTGPFATAGVLALSDGTKTVAAALDHMHYYEPQALVGLSDNLLAIDIAADQTWLGARQGLFGRFGVSVSPGEPDASTLRSSLWAKLNHPLRAWPSAAWFAASQAVEEFPIGDLAPEWQGYDLLLPTLLDRTTNLVQQLGLPGLQTYGLFPRYWGNPAEAYDELTNNAADPTPNESWDDLYWGATWTDYHNTSAIADFWAMRSGNCKWLDEVAAPAARRMLHTQIIHGAPEDSYFYIGQSPCGYGGYRADFNSSHAYFDNLLLYYWLTGDYTVVETLQRGASSMRSYYTPGRPSAPIDPLQPAPDDYSHPVSRVAAQWMEVFRFVGLASDDPTYLDDFRGQLSRAVSQYYAELNRDGRRYGFWCDRPLSTPGFHTTDQIWMAALYDLNNLYRWLVDSQDTPIGSPPLRPSDVLTACARTLTYLAPNISPLADGSVEGQWPNAICFKWGGTRIGGQLLGVTNHVMPAADPFLWDTGKAVLSATVSRAAGFCGDPAMRQLASDLARRTIRVSWNQGTPSPLGKEQGLYLSRLPQAVARLNPQTGPHLQFIREDQRLFVLPPDLSQPWTLENTPSLSEPAWEPVTHGLSAYGLEVDLPAASNSFFRIRLPSNP